MRDAGPIAGQMGSGLDPEPSATWSERPVGPPTETGETEGLSPVRVCESEGAGATPGATRPAAGGVLLGDASPAVPGVRMFPATRETAGAVLCRPASEGELQDLRERAMRRRRPEPLPRSVANQELLNAWVTYLGPHFDTCAAANVTVTYSDTYGYSHGLMLVRNVERDLERLVRELGRESDSWVAGIEYHPTTHRAILHAHMMVGGDWTESQLSYAKMQIDAVRGWSVVKHVTEAGGCVEYCAKHLLKQRQDDCLVFRLQQRPMTRYQRRVLGLLPPSTWGRDVIPGPNGPDPSKGQGPP